MDRDVNRVNGQGDTPLHVATRSMNAAGVDRLLASRHIQPNPQNSRGDLPLHIACSLAEDAAVDGIDRTIVNRLLSHPRTNAYLMNLDRLTPLQIAIQKDHAPLVSNF